MKKIINDRFESLLQNEEFIRLLKCDASMADQMIDDLCRKNPEDNESIRLAAQLVRRYQAEQLDLDAAQTTLMWNTILKKSEVVKSRRIFQMGTILRIAASVAILVSLTFYFYHYSNNNSIRKFAKNKVEVNSEARIIISDGSEYKLKSNDSHIRYDSDGKEIVIEEKNDKTQKVSNQPTEEFKSKYNQIVVPFGRRHSVMLCDGTLVQLNSGSKLVFPAKFSHSKREVFLKGEGYFEVAKDDSKPFIVRTEFINVKVLGTQFNLSAYENEKQVSAVLVEGSVEVYNNNFFNNNLCRIKPGEGCFFTNNETGLKIQHVNVSEFVSWKDGYFQIKDQEFGTIIKKVEKYYNKTIVFGNDDLAHRIISGKLVLAEGLEETLEFLASTTKSRFILKEDGTYIFTN